MGTALLSVVNALPEPALAPDGLRPGQPDSWGFEGVSGVEIVTPDGYSAALLVEYTALVFAGEVIFDSGWVVRFERPSRGGDWVVELLALVEGWLKAVPLPCARIRQGGRSYLVRVPIESSASPYPMVQRPGHVEGGSSDAA